MGIKSVTSAFGKSKVELTQVVKNKKDDDEDEFEHV